jgi:DNA-binding response OmpR family regulator
MKKLLIVDDDSRPREILTDFFQHQYIVFSAGRGDQAMRYFLEESPDAVLLDYELEGALQGNHLLKLMKRVNQDAIIVMVTGRSDLEKDLLDMGADGFLGKPCDIFTIRDFLIQKNITPHSTSLKK